MSEMTTYFEPTAVPQDACAAANDIDVSTNPANTYRVATQKYVNDAVTEHDTSSFAHSGMLDGFIRTINGVAGKGHSAEVSSIRILGDDGKPQFEIFADGTVVFDNVTSKVALVDGGSSEERGLQAYTILKACSADWAASNSVTQGTSARNERVNDAVEGLSGYWSNAASVTVATSARNESACAYTSRLSQKVPTAVWNIGNSVADMETVRKAISDTASNYRGSWDSWSAVPTVAEQYPEDATGSHTPIKNDTIVVLDASELEYRAEVNGAVVGSILKQPAGTLPAGHMLTSNDILDLYAAGIRYVIVIRNGMWRFRFSGTWAEGPTGKNRWKPEARISNVSLTEAQIETLDSGFTADDHLRHFAMSEAFKTSGNWNSTYETVCSLSGDWTKGGGSYEKVESVFSTTSSCSSKWETVDKKLALSSINYYTEAAWEALTRDDTYYGNVPYGFSLIYEEGGGGTTPYAYYGMTTGLLLLSDSATFSAGELVLPLSDTFSTTSGTYTMYGSSINLSTFMVENHLTHAYNLNTAYYVASGDPYAATVVAENGYYLKSLICTMGGAVVKLRDGRIDIPSVSGNIVVTAVGAPTGGSAMYFVSSGAFTLPESTEFSTDNGLLTFGSAVSYEFGSMTINGNKFEAASLNSDN